MKLYCQNDAEINSRINF